MQKVLESYKNGISSHQTSEMGLGRKKSRNPVAYLKYLNLEGDMECYQLTNSGFQKIDFIGQAIYSKNQISSLNTENKKVANNNSNNILKTAETFPNQPITANKLSGPQTTPNLPSNLENRNYNPDNLEVNSSAQSKPNSLLEGQSKVSNNQANISDTRNQVNNPNIQAGFNNKLNDQFNIDYNQPDSLHDSIDLNSDIPPICGDQRTLLDNHSSLPLFSNNISDTAMFNNNINDQPLPAINQTNVPNDQSNFMMDFNNHANPIFDQTNSLLNANPDPNGIQNNQAIIANNTQFVHPGRINLIMKQIQFVSPTEVLVLYKIDNN